MGGSIGKAQTGFLKSIPKLTRINGDDNLKVIYRNLGNNHAYPFVWAESFTVASGTSEVTLASGVKFHGYDLASYANVTVTPCYNAGTNYITKDTTANTIKCTVANAGANDGSSTLDVKFMLGMDPMIDGIYCRGNTGAMPSYP
ncbi:hypothetical protein DRQ25_01525 [Candidatus Fermentibacteria bacterium]|nr:MAG: hypothetical protein DRQ25_01525 [Candidatus Fermentibacteria bacterium]